MELPCEKFCVVTHVHNVVDVLLLQVFNYSMEEQLPPLFSLANDASRAGNYCSVRPTFQGLQSRKKMQKRAAEALFD